MRLLRKDALRVYIRRDQRSLVSVLLRPCTITSLVLVTDYTWSEGIRQPLPSGLRRRVVSLWTELRHPLRVGLAPLSV